MLVSMGPEAIHPGVTPWGGWAACRRHSEGSSKVRLPGFKSLLCDFLAP